MHEITFASSQILPQQTRKSKNTCILKPFIRTLTFFYPQDFLSEKVTFDSVLLFRQLNERGIN